MGYYLTEHGAAPEPDAKPSSSPSRMGAKTPIGAPFGKAILSSKYWDEDTSQYYYGYRYLKDGRWLSRDPIYDVGFILERLDFENMNVFDAAVFGDPKFESYDIKVRSETDLAQIEYLLARNNPVNDVDVLGMFLDKWSQSGCENTSAGTMFCNDWKCTKETSEMSCKLKKGLINPHIYEGMCETRVYGYADTVGAGGASLRSCACCQTFLKKCEKTNKNKGKPWQPSIFEVCAYAKGGYNEGDPYFPELYFKTKEECENYGKKTK